MVADNINVTSSSPFANKIKKRYIIIQCQHNGKETLETVADWPLGVSECPATKDFHFNT
jgi:hypothetical protein